MVLNQVGPIYHCTYVPGPFDQYIYDSEYNAACTLLMALSHSSMLNKDFLNKDLDVVPE